MNNIKTARLEKNLTGAELGALVGVQKSAISKYERDKAQPSKEILTSLANVLGCSIDYLLGREVSTVSETEKNETRLSGIEYALYGELHAEIRELSEEEQESLLKQAKMFNEFRKLKNQKENQREI